MVYALNEDSSVLEIRERLNRIYDANFPGDGKLIISRVLHPQPADTKGLGYMFTQEQDRPLLVTTRGIVGARRYCQEREMNGREKHALPRGAHLRNHRHLLAVSELDCKKLSDRMGVEITPELLGANLVLSREDGEPFELTALLYGTDLQIYPQRVSQLPKNDEGMSRPPQNNEGLEALLRVQAEQMGCKMTGNSIAMHYNDKSLVSKFIENSKENRGLILSLEHPVEADSRKAEFRPGQVVYVRYPTGKTL